MLTLIVSNGVIDTMTEAILNCLFNLIIIKGIFIYLFIFLFSVTAFCPQGNDSSIINSKL